jgi:hypothetical protein
MELQSQVMHHHLQCAEVVVRLISVMCVCNCCRTEATVCKAAAAPAGPRAARLADPPDRRVPLTETIADHVCCREPERRLQRVIDEKAGARRTCVLLCCLILSSGPALRWSRAFCCCATRPLFYYMLRPIHARPSPSEDPARLLASQARSYSAALLVPSILNWLPVPLHAPSSSPAYT